MHIIRLFIVAVDGLGVVDVNVLVGMESCLPTIRTIRASICSWSMRGYVCHTVTNHHCTANWAANNPGNVCKVICHCPKNLPTLAAFNFLDVLVVRIKMAVHFYNASRTKNAAVKCAAHCICSPDCWSTIQPHQSAHMDCLHAVDFTLGHCDGSTTTEFYLFFRHWNR